MEVRLLKAPSQNWWGSSQCYRGRGQVYLGEGGGLSQAAGEGRAAFDSSTQRPENLGEGGGSAGLSCAYLGR